LKTREYTFFGGIHPRSYKELSNKYPIEEYLPKSQVIIPLQQHIGAPCTPLVKVNDYVKVGQKSVKQMDLFLLQYILVYRER